MSEIKTTKANLPQVFNYESEPIRTLLKDDNSVWFYGIDVCKVLDIKNSRDALSKLKSSYKGVVLTDTLGGKQEVTIISESGLYKLVLKSRKKEAEKFQDWICEEVLPQIRETGSYSAHNKKADEVSRKELALMILQAEEEREKLLLENNQLKYEKTFAENKITELTPKALLLDVLVNTTELKTVKQLGYKLKPFGLGPLKIFELLRNEKIITKVNGENYPTHAYTNYFVTDAVTKAWQDSKTGNIKNKTFDILKVKSEFYPVLAQVLIKNKILTSDQFNEIDFNNVPADSSIDNQIFY